eukprot:3475270-Rhodomonas_salina.3
MSAGLCRVISDAPSTMVPVAESRSLREPAPTLLPPAFRRSRSVSLKTSTAVTDAEVTPRPKRWRMEERSKPGCELSPNMVASFPLPACPYANTIEFCPEHACCTTACAHCS